MTKARKLTRHVKLAQYLLARHPPPILVRGSPLQNGVNDAGDVEGEGHLEAPAATAILQEAALIGTANEGETRMAFFDPPPLPRCRLQRKRCSQTESCVGVQNGTAREARTTAKIDTGPTKKKEREASGPTAGGHHMTPTETN